VRSKEKILAILHVVEKMNLHLRLSQLLHLQSIGKLSSIQLRDVEAQGGGTHRRKHGSLWRVGDCRRACKSASSEKVRLWLVNDDGTGILDSRAVLAVILLLVFTGLATTMLEETHLQGHESAIEAFEVAALSAFALEMSLRMFAMGIRRYLKDAMCSMDMLVVVIDVVLLALEEYLGAFSHGGAAAGASIPATNSTRFVLAGTPFGALDNVSLLRGLRMLRFTRLLRLQRVYQKAKAMLKTQAKGETLSQQDIKQFEELFKNEEKDANHNEQNFSSALNLNLMGKRERLSGICLDLLMYQSSSLFEAAFFSLESSFCQRKSLVEAASAVQLVPHNQEQSFNLMNADLRQLRSIISSFAYWARSEGKGNLKQGEIMLDTLGKLTELCTMCSAVSDSNNLTETELCIEWSQERGWRKLGEATKLGIGIGSAATRPPNPRNQALLEKLDVHGVVLRAIELRPANGAASLSQSGSDLGSIVAQIQAACARFMREFARENPRGVRVAAEHVPEYLLILKHAESQAQKTSTTRTQLVGYIELAESIDQLLLSLVQQSGLSQILNIFSDDTLRALTALLQRRVVQKSFKEAERLLEIITCVFMHADQPVRELQERVMLATTSRTSVKTVCFDPFVRDRPPIGQRATTAALGEEKRAELEKKCEESQRRSYQVAVINFFSDLCIGHSVQCEAVVHKLLPLDIALQMITSLDAKLFHSGEVPNYARTRGISPAAMTKDRCGAAMSAPPNSRGLTKLRAKHHADSMRTSDDGDDDDDSDIGDEECEELQDHHLASGEYVEMGNSGARPKRTQTHEKMQTMTPEMREHRDLYKTRGALARFIAEAYFETLEVLQHEQKLALLQNAALWTFVQESIRIIQEVHTAHQDQWQDTQYTHFVGLTIFSLTIFYDYVFDDARFHGDQLSDLFNALRTMADPKKTTLQETMQLTADGRACYNYACVFVEDLSKLIASTTFVSDPEEVRRQSAPLGFPIWVAARSVERGSWTASVRSVRKAGRAAEQRMDTMRQQKLEPIQFHTPGGNSLKRAAQLVSNVLAPQQLVAHSKAKRECKKRMAERRQINLEEVVMSLRTSPAVRKAIAADFDRFAQWILNVEEHTTIDPNGKAYCQSKTSKKAGKIRLVMGRLVVAVKKEQLVGRMVDYVRQFQQVGGAHGDEVCLGVLRLLRHCLVLKQRALTKAVEESLHTQHHSIKQALLEWENLQQQFTRYGVARVVVDVVSSSRSHELVLAALQLGKTLALGGSTVVQESVYQRLKEHRSETFFDEIGRCIEAEENRLTQSLRAAMNLRGPIEAVLHGSDSEEDEEEHEARHFEDAVGALTSEEGGHQKIPIVFRWRTWLFGNRGGKAEEDTDADQDETILDEEREVMAREDDGMAGALSREDDDPAGRRSGTHIKPVMQFLRHLCENHYAPMQHAMRDQSGEGCGNHKTTNLVECRYARSCRRKTRHGTRLGFLHTNFTVTCALT
jgi:hypothetical protein